MGGTEIVTRALTILTVVCAPVLAAQPPTARPRPFLYPCNDSTSEPYRKRVLIDLMYEGTNRREMWTAIEMAADHAGICLATRGDASPPADTSVFGRLTINRVGDGATKLPRHSPGLEQIRVLLA